MAENYKNDVEKLKHHLTILLDGNQPSCGTD